MEISITEDRVSIVNPTVTSRLAVVIADGLDPARANGNLQRSNLGTVDEAGEHANIDIARLRDLATGEGCQPDDFGRMVAYAESSGWVADGFVRAHLETAPVEPRSEFQRAHFDQRKMWWRSVLGEYPTGVAIVAALDAAGDPQGLVVGTFSSVSLDPPLVSFMPMGSSRAYAAIKDASRFRVSVLGAVHEQLCRSFASSAPERRFDVGNWAFDAHGIPRLVDAVAWFDCIRSQTIPAGDHDIVLGEVEDLGFGEGNTGMPMLFLKGGYGTFTMPRLEFEADHLGMHLRAADQMRDDVQRLAEDLDAVVTLCSRAKDTVVVLAAANLHSTSDAPRAVGSTFPFAAPMGLVFAAWSDDPIRINSWRKAGTALGFTDNDLLERMLERVRERGYAVSVGGAMAEQFELITSNPNKGASELYELWARIAEDYAQIGESPEWTAHVSSIQVPVFGVKGEPDLALVVSGLTGLTPDALDTVAREAMVVAERLCAEIGGVPVLGA